MSLISDLQAVGKVQIGAGAQYAVIGEAIEESFDPRVEEGLLAHTAVGIEWRISCLALAAGDSVTNVPALIDAIKAGAVAGQVVTLTEFNGVPAGSVRTLPAPGATNGSLDGWPRCTVKIDRTVGAFVFFTLTARTVVPVLGAASGGFNLVSHTWSLRTTTKPDGMTEISRTGSVRVAPTQIARNWIVTNVITPAETAADADGRLFTYTINEGPESSICGYEYRDTGVDSGGTPGVTTAEVNDATTESVDGRTRRIVSGWATGSSATTFANAQKPAPSSTNLLVSDRVNSPRYPDGRVDFSFEMLTGVSGASFIGGGVVFSLRHEIRHVSGGRGAISANYADDDPVIYYGEKTPYVISESIEVEFTGRTYAQAEAGAVFNYRAPLALDALASPSRSSWSGGTVLRRVRVDRTFIFATSPGPLAAPIEMPALT